MLNQAIVEKLPDLITAENITKFQHIEAYNYELVEKIKTDSSVKFFLKVGDHFLLQEMERHLLPIEPKLNRKIKRLPKVKAPLKRQRDELLCEIEVQNEEPPSKRVKLTNEQMLIVFSNFVTKNINGSGVDVILDGSGAAPKFKLRCSTCSKEICIGYKITSAGSPSFIKTNLMKHVCFKVRLLFSIGLDSNFL